MMLDKIAMQHKLTPAMRIVLWAIALQIEQGNNAISHEEIAQKVCLNKDTVRRLVADLHFLGFLTYKRETGKEARRNQYALTEKFYKI